MAESQDSPESVCGGAVFWKADAAEAEELYSREIGEVVPGCCEDEAKSLVAHEKLHIRLFTGLHNTTHL